MATKLTKEQMAETSLASYWNQKFKDSMVAKAPFTKRWAKYWDAWRGDYFKDKSLPDYKSNLVSNYIFSIIETIRPIMFDNDPKFQAIPRQPAGLEFSNDWQECLSYEWDRENMTTKFIREAITTLVTGTSVLFLPWDAKHKNVKPVFINPDNVFVDPLATSVEDASYIIYARYFHDEVLKQQFPDKVDRLQGSQVNYSELVQERNRNSKVDNQVLVLEVWCRDYQSKEMDEHGNPFLKYPNGRVLTLAPERGIVFTDKPNPYIDGNFPFLLLKDYDVPGQFWGEGEVAQLLSPQQYMNELNNAIIDNAKVTANAPWVIDKNSGIGEGKITSRAGLIIRKNPGTEVKREQPVNMPNYVATAVDSLKGDMEQVSGIFDSIKGNSETGVYTAQGILALQEAGQARIRLKVKLLEQTLSNVAKTWVSRIRQFWKEQRFIGVTRFDGSYDVKEFQKEALSFDYDVKITAGSTMPVNRGAMLDLMVRLAQTPMPDGQNLVDREAVVNYLPEEVKSSMLKRMNTTNTQLQQQVEQLSQELQQIQQQDQGTVQTLDNVAGALEKLKQEILHLQDKHDKLEKDKSEQEKLNNITKQSYNQGYSDAEGFAKGNEQNPMGESPMMGQGMMGAGDNTSVSPENMQASQNGIPDDLLNALSGMSDQELSDMLAHHPELQGLVK
jgi:hypothetical protein